MGVGRIDAHSVQFGDSISVGGEFASDDLVLVETRHGVMAS